MKYVYILQSDIDPERFYVGTTLDLKRRLAEHNSGETGHTRKFAPWNLVNYVAFSNHQKADHFEKYLKSGSGRAFAKKHF
jgi:predicted GIY-YIG superfamily endonuclease